MNSFEKVNPSHPDKVADRIAGAIVDLAYQRQEEPKIAVEVLIGHELCTVIIESSVDFTMDDIEPIVYRITGNYHMEIRLKSVKQDTHLANNQKECIKCGDNGIFKGMPLSEEEVKLSALAKTIYEKFPSDGKYIMGEKNIFCQSNADNETLKSMLPENSIINPLGEWVGGTDVDCGATNRKLGSDMGQAVTGGGLHGKDLSKADVSVNIYCYLKAQILKKEVNAVCAIGDTNVLINGVEVPYSDIVTVAKEFVKTKGGFEKFAEWGLV